MRRLYLFVQEGEWSTVPAWNAQRAPNLRPFQRQKLWIELLESISPIDAELLEIIKDKKTPYKRISAHLVKKAYPTLIEVKK